MTQQLMCTDRDAIAAYGAAENAYFTWLDDVTDHLRDLGADPSEVRAFYSHDGYTSITVPVIDPSPPGWARCADGTTMRPVAGPDGAAARAWLDRWRTHAEPIRALVAHGLPAVTWTPGPPGGAGRFGRPAEHVFDDVVVVTTGRAERFRGRPGPAWTPIPRGLFDAVLLEHGVTPTVAA